MLTDEKPADDLYFMRGMEYVKIGRSRDAFARRCAIQLGLPFEIELIAVLPGCGPEERSWHKRFSDKRVRGEWFEWCGEIADAIEFAQCAPSLARLLQMQDEGEL